MSQTDRRPPSPVHKLQSAIGQARRIGLPAFAYQTYRRYIVNPLIVAPYKPLKGYQSLLPYLQGGRGLEVGGPSSIFSAGQQLPIYPQIDALDMCNFATETVWEGRIQEGDFLLGGRVLGHQYICEATEIGARLAGQRYDFILSSNCLEHLANPLKAVEGWTSLLKPGGLLILALPNKTSNFDRLRPDTTFDHLLDDYAKDVGEDDKTHYAEIIELTDLRLTSKALIPDRDALIRQTENGISNRCNHHHIFSLALMEQICRRFGLETVFAAEAGTDHVIAARSRS